MEVTIGDKSGAMTSFYFPHASEWGRCVRTSHRDEQVMLIFEYTDILALIPEEVALYLLTFLDLSDILACSRVSR